MKTLQLHVANDFLEIYMTAFQAAEVRGEENPYAEACYVSGLKYEDVGPSKDGMGHFSHATNWDGFPP
jgi:hypothetical protein